jgi:hypothetical protein
MQKVDNHDRFSLRVLLLLAYTFGILALLPFFPMLWAWAARHFPQGIKALTIGPVVCGGLLFLFERIFIKKIRSRLYYLGLAVMFFFYFVLIAFWCRFPAERLHVAEYSLLALLAHGCLESRFKNAWVYPAALGYCLLVGCLDEGTQYFLPNRVFEFRDLFVNWLASLLAVANLGLDNLNGFKKQNVSVQGF